jgi:hypothetical protein
LSRTAVAPGLGKRLDDSALTQGLVVFDEDEVDHEPHDFTRREMLAGRFVGLFREAPDQFLEHLSHDVVGHSPFRLHLSAPGPTIAA